MEVCILCKDQEGDMNKVGNKGFKTLMRRAIERDEHDLIQELKGLEKAEDPTTVYVHHKCRRAFNDDRKKEPDKEPKRLRSSSGKGNCFEWKTCCYICGKSVDIARHKDRDQIRLASTIELRENMIECAQERKDELGRVVLERLESCIDLVATDALYHLDCATNFRLKTKQQSIKKGRPVDTGMKESFEAICHWLECESETEIYSVEYLYQKMTKESITSYSKKTFRAKLKERFQDHVYFVESLGSKGELVCFTGMADFIIRRLKENPETKESVINAAAKLIKEDIRAVNLDKKVYPSVAEISTIGESSFVPESLGMFMEYLVPDQLKRESLSQCIFQASRPRSSIMPVPFAIGVQVDKTMGSKWLINHLYHLGFSVSYDEVQRFKQSAIVNMETQATNQEVNPRPLFPQWVADNVDHDIATLSGKNTFHGMGIICASSKPGGNFGSIPRLFKKPAKEFSKELGVPIIPCTKVSKTGLLNIKLHPINEMKKTCSFSSMETYNLLWHSAWMFSPPETPRPNWSGFLQCSTKSFCPTYQRSEVSFLPIIDLNSSNETCIYSTLTFIIAQSKKLNVETPCVTFDQPLWIKALGIIYSENLSIVCRLGGFHTLMSFLGSIGAVMKGSGIEDLLAEIYALNSIPHIMSGKAIARAIRAHILIESALTSLLFEMINETSETKYEVVKSYYQECLNGNLSSDALSELKNDPAMTTIEKDLKKLKTTLKTRTSKLWISYMDHVHLMKMFIYAERTSDWELHLYVLQKMLNLFAATGHFKYARCTRLYVQQMKELPEKYPFIYHNFVNGNHTIRKTSRNWNGIWTDLAIEQLMMRSLKTRGGLTVGRGMTENVRHQWVLSLNHCAAVHNAMTEVTGASYKSSEQHNEMGKSRTKQDSEDCRKLLYWLSERNPFLVPGDDLRSLSSGLVSVKGKDKVNCEDSEIEGERMQNAIDNELFNEVSFKRNDIIKPLASLLEKAGKTGDKIADPTTLFTRMIIIAEREPDLEAFFEYELTTEPMALFKDGMLRKPDKPAIRKIIMPEKKAIEKENIKDVGSTVVDGGALIHRVRWEKGLTFNKIAEKYSKYVINKYGFSTVIVFDGYKDESIKSHEHRRRTSIPQSCHVEINPENKMPFTQDRYLSNTENKAAFIKFLSIFLKDTGIKIVNCPGDADAVIVKTALALARKNKVRPIIVAADDTDIAVMLVHHWCNDLSDIYFLQERWNKAWSVKDSCAANDNIKKDLLFLHAFSGCDTTSAIFNQGKEKIVSICNKSSEMKDISEVMNSPWSTQSEVGNASVKAMKLLYGGKVNDTLQRIRLI